MTSPSKTFARISRIANKIRLPQAILLAMLVFVLSGCFSSYNPLFSAQESPLDPQLLGGWTGTGNDQGSVLIIEADPERTHYFIATEKIPKRETPVIYQGFTSTVEGCSFINSQDTEGNFNFARYEIKMENGQKTLRISTIKDEALGRALTNKQVEGTVEEEPMAGPLYHFTSESPALRQWIVTLQDADYQLYRTYVQASPSP